jgi:hypothetical protein
MAGVLLKAGTAYPSRAHGFTPVFGGIRVTIFLLFCVVLYLSLSSVLFAQCYQFLWIVHSFLIAPSVISNVYLTQSWIGNIVRVAVLAINVLFSRTYLLFNISYTGSILVKLHWSHNVLLYMVTYQDIVFWGLVNVEQWLKTTTT